MKKYFFLFFSFILIFTLQQVFAQEQIDSTDKARIDSSITILISAFNNRDTELVKSVISSQEKVLITEIQKKINEDIQLDINFSLLDGGYDIEENGDVRVKGTFNATGSNWEISGFKTYLLLRKVNDEWYIVDTDLVNKLDENYVFKIISKVFLIIIPVVILFVIFWIWMLKDCLKRDFEKRNTWLILLFILPISSFVYFFARKKYGEKIYSN